MQELWQSRLETKIEASLFERLLAARGFSDLASQQNLLAPQLKDLRDPLLLDQMDLAVERLVSARRQQESVAVYADFDLDGTSGLALLDLAFQQMGFQNLILHQPLRLSEGYGLHVRSVQELASRGVKVLVTVDVGITAIEAAQECQRLGIDLIITDHHLPKPTLPVAYAIVNPNKGMCPSQLGHLSGVGVAFYLAWALGRELKRQNLLESAMDLKGLLDVFVIGTLTDLVPLKDENRVLIKHGLLQLEKTRRPALAALIEALGIQGRPLTSADVAMQIAPKLNALSRLELGLMPRDVLALKPVGDIQQMITTVLSSNELRKNLQSEALVVAKEMAQAQSMPKSLPAVFVWDKSFHKGVIGLIATQLAKEFGKPAFVGHLDDAGLIHGSARIPDGSSVNLAMVLGELQHTVIRAGGHAAAAGFVLELARAQDFYSGLCGSLMNVQATVPMKIYDVEAAVGEISADFMSLYDGLEPFGKDFPAGLIRLSNVQITSRRELKGGHLKLGLSQRSQTLDALVFSPQTEWLEFASGESVDALVEPQWNYFRGQRKIQLLVRSLKRSST